MACGGAWLARAPAYGQSRAALALWWRVAAAAGTHAASPTANTSNPRETRAARRRSRRPLRATTWRGGAVTVSNTILASDRCPPRISAAALARRFVEADEGGTLEHAAAVSRRAPPQARLVHTVFVSRYCS